MHHFLPGPHHFRENMSFVWKLFPSIKDAKIPGLMGGERWEWSWFWLPKIFRGKLFDWSSSNYRHFRSAMRILDREPLGEFYGGLPNNLIQPMTN